MTDTQKLAPRIEDATDNIIRLCNERAASYGAMRESSLTAVALDCAAVMLAGQATRLIELEAASNAHVAEGYALVPRHATEAMIRAQLDMCIFATELEEREQAENLRDAWVVMMHEATKSSVVVSASDAHLREAAQHMIDAWQDGDQDALECAEANIRAALAENPLTYETVADVRLQEAVERCAVIAESEGRILAQGGSGGSYRASRAHQCELIAVAIRATIPTKEQTDV